MISLNYTPDGRVLSEFMQDGSFVRGIQGPIGSGKSVACCIEMFRLALSEHNTVNAAAGETLETPPEERTGPKKVRQCVIRNTTPQLETTTMKTWLEWFPEQEFGKVRWRAPFRQDMRIPELNLENEVWFLALDREEDVKKLLSFEFTHAFINEAREINRQIVTAAISRLSRYPRKIEGGSRRPCLVMDTNAPDEEHWWAIMSGQAEPPDWMTEEDRMSLLVPEGWKFFTQPPGVLDVMDGEGVLKGYRNNPERENAKYTDEEYYQRLLHGQTRDWIRNMLQNKIGRIFAGRPVYRDFNETLHVAAEPFGPDPEQRIIHVGIDWGLTPAACFGQDIRGQVRIFDELVTRDTHTVQFADILKKHIQTHYPDFKIVLTGDPAEKRSEVDGRTPFQIFKAAGLDVKPAWTNDPDVRMGAVQTQINTLVDGGRPGYFLSPSCTYLAAGKKGGYCYLPDREEVDKKSIYSHVADAEHYMMLRMGYGKRLIGRDLAQKAQVQATYKQNVFDRGGTRKQRRMSSILSRGIR